MATINIARNKDKDLDIVMYLNKLNRHGLIAGATGTGKTITLKVLAEQLSNNGIPVFMADIKGDLTSISQPGVLDDNINSRLKEYGFKNYQTASFPCHLWDVFGVNGTAIRSTVSEMGPMLLSRMMGLNEVQEGVLNIVFKIADEKQYLLLDLKDLQAMLADVGNHAQEYTTLYGNITKASIGTIQRELLVLENQGGANFFGEPAIDLNDFIQIDSSGKGIVNVLYAKELFNSPKLYATFLIWLVSELFENMPEVGDLDKPKLVFFFDEAHLLFNDASDEFLEQIEKLVRLIRSKGIGIFFITQNPIDLPDNVLGQLGNKIQHALRAFTPKDQKAVKAMAETFRVNDGIDVEKDVIELKTGEALISILNEDGEPTPVERAMVRVPQSLITQVNLAILPSLKMMNPFDVKYTQVVDRESAYEILQNKVIGEQQLKQQEEQAKIDAKAEKELAKQQAKELKEAEKAKKATVSYQMGKMLKQTAMRKVTNTVFKNSGSIVRGLLKNLIK
ncbi:MAG: DUF853 domain-containing protein [Bacilli bacterium]|jgi:DNA helicase HerA-like ATPase|nr:DUF853 domain-containing protein [Bacilli bacterium]